MKKLLLLFSYLILSISSFGQLTSNTFTGASACPTNGNTFSAVTNATVAPMSRNTAICSQTANVFSSTTLNNIASRNDNSYIEFSITANSGFGLNLTSLSFFRQGSNTAPNSLVVSYSTDPNPANFNATRIDMPISTTANPGSVLTWTFASAIVTTAGGKATFRFYPYGTTRVDLTATAASSSGTFRVDDVSVFGSVVNLTPTLTITPTTIPAFNYVFGSASSTAGSYTLSGSVLTPSAGDITITAPTNFEVSTTSATTGFTDNLLVSYTGGVFSSITVYVRLKAGLAIGSSYTGNITHSGGGVTTPPTVALSGSVTTVPPPVITTTGTLSTFYTLIGTPSATQSYTVSGVNLVSDITITAPTDFEIKTGAGAYANTLMLTPSSGNVPTTTIDVRLKGTNTGTYSGNISHASTNVSPDVNVAVSGKVGLECGTSVGIATFRSLIPVQQTYPGTAPGLGSKTIAGTVTAVLGTSKFYVQDATGGIAVFSSGVASDNDLVVGDQVKLTGTPVRFQGEVQMNNLTCMTKISSGIPLTPLVFDANNPPASTTVHDFMCANEGRLIKILSSNFSSSGTFASSFNYGIVLCNLQDATEIRVDAGSVGIIGTTIPNTVTQDVTGVLGRFVQTNTSNVNTADKLQIFPRNLSDLSASATSCAGPSSCGVTTFTDSPTKLDVMNWNVEWLGHPSNGPSQSGAGDATQIANAQSVLNGAGADIYVLQEICQYNSANPTDNTTAFGKLIEGLNTTFGVNTYSGECSSAFSTSFVDPNAQRVCVIYKNSVVTKIFSRPMFDGFTPATYPPTGTPSQFWASGRKPFMFMARVNINSQPDTILFVGLHAKAGSALDDYARRKYDVKVMYDTLQAQYSTRKTIVIGDLNDDVDKSIATTACNQLVSSYAPFLYTNPNETAVSGTRPNPSWNTISKTLSDSYCASTSSFPDYIDHQIISNELTGSGYGYKYVTGSVASFRPVVTNYANTTSDHYATVARYEYIAPPTTITSSNSGNWSSASTWDCTCVPTSASDVVINTGNTVTVNVTAQAKSLNIKGILNWLAAFTLTLGM
jgi:hypothetical protein